MAVGAWREAISIINIRGTMASGAIGSRILSVIHHGNFAAIIWGLHPRTKVLASSDTIFFAGTLACRTFPSLLFNIVLGEASDTAPVRVANIAFVKPYSLCFLPLYFIFLS
jgi:hypothetical protein